jgi:hypothetical protein
MDQVTTQAASEPVDIEKCVEVFVQLRDLKAEMKEAFDTKLKPLNDKMEELKDKMKGVLNASNAQNIKTNAGTVSLTSKVSASAADLNAFWTWVITQGAFDMLDKKPNVTAITEYVKQHGIPPPGVNYSVFQDVGVRRK